MKTIVLHPVCLESFLQRLPLWEVCEFPPPSHSAHSKFGEKICARIKYRIEASLLLFFVPSCNATPVTMSEQLALRGELVGHNGWVTSLATSMEKYEAVKALAFLLSIYDAVSVCCCWRTYLIFCNHSSCRAESSPNVATV